MVSYQLQTHGVIAGKDGNWNSSAPADVTATIWLGDPKAHRIEGRQNRIYIKAANGEYEQEMCFTLDVFLEMSDKLRKIMEAEGLLNPTP